jgi:hypothetical protein
MSGQIIRVSIPIATIAISGAVAFPIAGSGWRSWAFSRLHAREACLACYRALELEQVASSLPSEITKSCQRPARRIASAALDDRRPRRSVGMSNLDRQASAGLAHKFEFLIVERNHQTSS